MGRHSRPRKTQRSRQTQVSTGRAPYGGYSTFPGTGYSLSGAYYPKYDSFNRPSAFHYPPAIFPYVPDHSRSLYSATPVVPQKNRSPKPNLTPNHSCSRLDRSKSLWSKIKTTADEAGGKKVAETPTTPTTEPQPISSTVGCNTSGDVGCDEQQRRKEAPSEAAAAAEGMGGGEMHASYHCLVKGFDEFHICDDKCTGEYDGVAEDYVEEAAEAEYYEPGWTNADCERTDGPYHQCGLYCVARRIAARAAAEKTDGHGHGHGSSGQASHGLQKQTAGSIATTNAEPSSLAASATVEDPTVPIVEEGINQRLRLASGTTTGSEPEFMIEEETASGEFGRCVLITKSAAATETPVPSMGSELEVSPTLAAAAEAPGDPPGVDIRTLTTALGKKKWFDGEMEGSLEDEARKHRAARELRKKNRGDPTSTRPAGDGDYARDLDYALAKQLALYDSWGFLKPPSSDDEEEDAPLVHYGDSFGLAVLSEYPDFFLNVPQRPHYNEASLKEVNEEDAEMMWELLMPLIRRGLRAARERDDEDLAAVEQVAAGFEARGFDLIHLRAYIRTSRRLWKSRLSTLDELQRVEADIEREKKKIDVVASSSKPLREAVEELEAEKFRYQQLIEGIELDLAEKRALLGEEEVIRETGSTPEMEELLRYKGALDEKYDVLWMDCERLGL